MLKHPPYYLHPPVIERVASVFSPVEEKLFETRFDDWVNIVKAEFPVDESLRDWIIKAEEKDGLPVFDTMHPILRLVPRFSKKSSHEGFDWSIRCPAGQFTLNMHSDPEEGKPRRYRHLRDEFASWVPLWVKHFDVSREGRLVLHYVNALTPRTLPQFFSGDRLFLSKVIAVFADIPGEHESIVQPYSCEVTLALKGESGATFRIKVGDCALPRFGAGVKVDFIAEIPIRKGKTSTAEYLLELLDEAHSHIIHRFELIFTQEAKKSFQPIEE